MIRIFGIWRIFWLTENNKKWNRKDAEIAEEIRYTRAKFLAVFTPPQ